MCSQKMEKLKVVESMLVDMSRNGNENRKTNTIKWKQLTQSNDLTFSMGTITIRRIKIGFQDILLILHGTVFLVRIGRFKKREFIEYNS